MNLIDPVIKVMVDEDLQFVIKNLDNFLRLNTEILKGLAFTGMVEAPHQPGGVHAERDPLIIAPGFAQGMTAVIATEIDGRAPLLDQSGQARGAQHRSLAASEKIVVFRVCI